MKIIMVLLVMALISAPILADETSDDRPAFLDEIKLLNSSGDSFKAIEYINNQADPAKSAQMYEEIIKEDYWKDIDIANTIFFAQIGISYLLTENIRLRVEDPQAGYEVKKRAKAICYNLASFCWPGWDEEGIILGQNEIQIGFDAAKTNMRLASELGEKGLSLSYDYWMLGAMQLAVQDYQNAKTSFLKAKQAAHDDSDLLNELLAEGYIAATMVIEGSPDGEKRLGELINRLTEDGSEDALYYVEQINTVLGIFIK